MATYVLTALNDSLIGADTEADVFVVQAAGRLAAADTIQGGSGNFIDAIRLTGSFALAAGAFAHTRGIERIQIGTAAGASVELDDAMVASTHRANLQVLGGTGGDTVLGGGVLATPLHLEGQEGPDRLEGGGGNDLIRPGSGADTAFGGAGADTIEMLFADLGANDLLDGGAGSDVLRLSGAGALGRAQFAALRQIERIEIGPDAAGPLVVQVAPGYVIGGGVALAIIGTVGPDTMSAQQAMLAVLFDGGDGADRLVGGAFADTLLGGRGNDLLAGLGGNDLLDGGEGDDRLSGDAGDDLVVGQAGNDTLLGGAGADTLALGAGFDRADGGFGDDLYLVPAGELAASDLIADESGAADALHVLDMVGPGNLGFVGVGIIGALAGRLLGIERFLLGSGDDVFLPGNGIGDSAGADAMTVGGGGGNDRLDGSQVARLTTPLRFWFEGGAGDDALIGGRGADTLDAGTGEDRIRGGLGQDLILMPSADFTGADILNGEAWMDTLRLTGNEPVGAAAFANVTGIEIVELAQGGQAVTLPGAFAQGLGLIVATIRGGDGDDLIDVSDFPPANVSIELGPGNDTLIGGAGYATVAAGPGVDDIRLSGAFNRVAFGPDELSAFDIVAASTGFDTDALVVGVAAGRTLAQDVFAGVSGFDNLYLDGGPGSAARLPGNLVAQSGQSVVRVEVMGQGMVVDGRGLGAAIHLHGGDFEDALFGGSGADTLAGADGPDLLFGGPGGDRILLGGASPHRDAALLRALSDGTADINTSQNLAGADSVTGTEFEDNFIMVDGPALGLEGLGSFYVLLNGNIPLNQDAILLHTGNDIADDDFGSLTAVRHAVGNRLVANNPNLFERVVLVIGGASNTRFGVYLFEDRDHNATVDAADILRLLAIGTGDVPAFGEDRGFRVIGGFDIL